jgi:uncharacterized repeat protein (TIGR01451 family)
MKKLRTLIAAIVIALLPSISAYAVQSPVGCNSNRLNLSLSRDKITVQQGDTLTYTVTISNLDSGPNLACDIDTAQVTLTLPAMDGSATGTVVNLATNASYPAGTPVTVVGTVPYVVNVNPGVVDITSEANVDGVLHDAPTDHAASITKTIGTAVVTEDTPTNPEDDTPADDDLPGLPNAGVVRR